MIDSFDLPLLQRIEIGDSVFINSRFLILSGNR